jgi:hypothetical protein
MEPNPLAALAPPPEELKKRCSRSRYGLGSRSLDDYLDPTGDRPIPPIPASSPQTLHVRHVRTRSRPASSIYPVSRDVRRTGRNMGSTRQPQPTCGLHAGSPRSTAKRAGHNPQEQSRGPARTCRARVVLTTTLSTQSRPRAVRSARALLGKASGCIRRRGHSRSRG